MLILLIMGLVFLTLLGLIYLLSLAPTNTICPVCQKKKPPKQHGWKTLCSACERSENE